MNDIKLTLNETIKLAQTLANTYDFELKFDSKSSTSDSQRIIELVSPIETHKYKAHFHVNYPEKDGTFSVFYLVTNLESGRWFQWLENFSPTDLPKNSLIFLKEFEKRMKKNEKFKKTNNLNFNWVMNKRSFVKSWNVSFNDSTSAWIYETDNNQITATIYHQGGSKETSYKSTALETMLHIEKKFLEGLNREKKTINQLNKNKKLIKDTMSSI